MIPWPRRRSWRSLLRNLALGIALLPLFATSCRAQEMWSDPATLAWTAGTWEAGSHASGNSWATLDHVCILSWTNSAGAASYNVYASGVSGGPYMRIASGIAGLSYDAPAERSTQYYFVVTAVNLVGESSYSNAVEAIIPDT